MWLMKMSYRWFLFQCQPPVPWGFLFIKYEVRGKKYEVVQRGSCPAREWPKEIEQCAVNIEYFFT